MSGGYEYRQRFATTFRPRSSPGAECRMNRRHMLQAAALSGTSMAAIALIGCGEEKRSTAPAAPAVKQPKRGGTLTHSQNIVRTPLLDPHVDSPVIAAYWRLFYQGLLGYNLRTFEVEPELAEKWEQPSQTEYVFTLQAGVKWQNKPPLDGRLLTIDDVVFSLERVRTNNPRFTSRTLFEGVKIEAIDKSRIKLTTKGPDASFLSKLSSDAALIVAPEVVQKTGGQNDAMKGFSADLAIGTGPFLAKSLEESVSAEFVRNPEYWKRGLPYLDALRIVGLIQGPGDERGWAAFLAKQVDITTVPGTEVKNYIARQGPGFTPDWAKDLALYHAAPNVKVSPFNDVRVTKALRLLIDHDEINAAWAEPWSGRGQHGGFLAANLDNWDLSHEEYTRFLEWKQPKDEAVREAVTLLAAAGFTRGNPLRVEISVSSTPSFKALGELLDSQGGASGRELSNQNSKFWKRRPTRQYEPSEAIVT